MLVPFRFPLVYSFLIKVEVSELAVEFTADRSQALAASISSLK